MFSFPAWLNYRSEQNRDRSWPSTLRCALRGKSSSHMYVAQNQDVEEIPAALLSSCRMENCHVPRSGIMCLLFFVKWIRGCVLKHIVFLVRYQEEGVVPETQSLNWHWRRKSWNDTHLDKNCILTFPTCFAYFCFPALSRLPLSKLSWIRVHLLSTNPSISLNGKSFLSSESSLQLQLVSKLGVY